LYWIKTPEEDRTPLTKKQDEVYRRTVLLISLLEKHRIDKTAIDIYIQVQADKGAVISKAQAYRDLGIAKYIIGNITQIHRKFERASLVAWQKERMERAVVLDDIRGFNQGMSNVIRILGLDREDPNPVDYSTFQPVRPIFGFFPELFAHNELPPDNELLLKIEELKNPKKFQKVSKNEEYVDFTEGPGRTNEKSTS